MKQISDAARDELAELLQSELRAAIADRLADGATPEELAENLEGRIRRVEALADDWTADPRHP